jgi:3-oxoacyl-(acyl-carrier-protein) synthase
MPCQFACEVKDFDPRSFGLDDEESTVLDRHVQFALAASAEALEDSRLELGEIDRARAGVFVGSTNGPADTFEAVWEQATNRGAHEMRTEDLRSQLYFSLLPSSAPVSIASRYRLTGPSALVSDACSSGMNAVGQACSSIRDGVCDLTLAGGADAAVTPLGIGCYSVLGALSRRNDNPQGASRPFDLDRDGFVMAEGSAMFVLEELKHARNRQAPIHGEILGLATNTNAYHMTALPASALRLAELMVAVLKRSRLEPQDVGYLNAHGTSTPMNDRHETKAVKTALGDRSRTIPISSTKSMIGHTQGAASAHQIAVLCLTLRDQVVHPTTNYEHPDPECDLDYVPNVAREARVDAAMANACGFGGINSTVVVGRWGRRA